jgi:hypothetical protein
MRQKNTKKPILTPNLVQKSLSRFGYQSSDILKPENQNLRRHFGERGQDTDLDSVDLDAVAALSATVLPFRLEPVQSRGAVAHESVYPP